VWRNLLIGQSTVDVDAALALLVIGCALAWRAMLRRGFVWAEPAALTWLDFTGVDRARVVGRRLWSAWLIGVVAVGYGGALVAAACGLPPTVWISATALLAGSAGLSLATARRAPIAGTLEVAGPIGLACRGVFVGLAGLTPVWLDVLAGSLLVAACAVWWGSGIVARPVIATRAGRAELVEGWNQRLVRAGDQQSQRFAGLGVQREPQRVRREPASSSNFTGSPMATAAGSTLTANTSATQWDTGSPRRTLRTPIVSISSTSVEYSSRTSRVAADSNDSPCSRAPAPVSQTPSSSLAPDHAGQGAPGLRRDGR
jgi:hypothetical protein